MECGGRAQRRHRFSVVQREQSGVALRFPPQSKNASKPGARALVAGYHIA